LRIFAISDLHLSFSRPKPMDRFGKHWHNHPKKIARHWEKTVHEDDVVLIPGDISWAMRMDEAKEDLLWLDRLAGRKIILKGNHDYWWPSKRKLRMELEKTSISALHNDSILLEDIVIFGSRLWTPPALEFNFWTQNAEEDAPTGEVFDEKRWNRELDRLEKSLESIPGDGLELLAMVHFPPVDPQGRCSTAAEMIAGAKARTCVFGHLHRPDDLPCPEFRVQVGGTMFQLVSADTVDFMPVQIWPPDTE
jgi:predicted phosphohydrolase